MPINIEKLKMLWKDKLVRRYILGGIVLFLSLGYFLAIVIPQLAFVARTSIEANDLKRKIKIIEDKISNIGKMREKLDGLNKQFEREAKYFPAQKEITGLLEGFADVATRSEVKILSITPYELKMIDSPDPQSKFYREMPIMITGKSGYHQLGNFISNLQQEKRILNIEDLQIRYDSSSPRMHDVMIMIKTYISVENGKK